MSLEDVIIHIRIEEQNRNRDNVEKAKELSSKANVVEEKPKPKNIGPGNKTLGPSLMHQTRSSNQLLKNEVIALSVASLDTMQLNVAIGRETEKSNSKANLVEAEVITKVISFEVSTVTNMKDWVVDSRVTRHICGNKSAFTSYNHIKEGEEQVFIGDSRSIQVIGKGKVLIKLTSRKVLTLSDVLHVLDICWNLVSLSLLGKARVRILFDSDKIVLTKNDAFVGKGYCNQGPKTFDAMLIGYAENSVAYSKYEDNTCVVICLYVDDMLIFGTSLEIMCDTKKFLGSKFDMKDLGKAELKKNREHAQIDYAQIIGSLMYLMNYTIPDIAYAISKLSWYTQSYNQDHWTAARRVLNDANWISDSNEKKSTNGYVFIIGGSAVSWKSAKKTCITWSTMEAEWLRNLLADIPLWMRPTPSVFMRCDSQTTITKAKSKIFNGKNKHIRLRHNIVRELLETRVISL
ncbi:Retrovirus-related Pol polyprotein from transposon TNT 1-94 [Vitis vinifera]|uniref:Retrovirus-related Pol polyprotein from transposon TNT 1-94 n=1 Tax=Vitis vinifera TaxID=29760 RepID=A0A438HHM2_VITVI|nr:Retrovirus-related Pol polyprotein from transposon TNT 1-94 [Vitis vinifera]